MILEVMMMIVLIAVMMIAAMVAILMIMLMLMLLVVVMVLMVAEVGFGDDKNAAGGRKDADRSYKPHAADRGSSRLITADRSGSQRIFATTKFYGSSGLKGSKRPLLLIASRNK